MVLSPSCEHPVAPFYLKRIKLQISVSVCVQGMILFVVPLILIGVHWVWFTFALHD